MCQEPREAGPPPAEGSPSRWALGGRCCRQHPLPAAAAHQCLPSPEPTWESRGDAEAALPRNQIFRRLMASLEGMQPTWTSARVEGVKAFSEP